MKTKLFFLVLLIICISCGTNNKPVSDSEKDKIKGEIKEIANRVIKGDEEANFDLVIESFLDSPDFAFIYNERIYTYNELMDFRPVFASLINQKWTVEDEKYVIPDNSTVLYTLKGKIVSNYKDGHSELADPIVMLFIFKKIDNRWRGITLVQNCITQSI